MAHEAHELLLLRHGKSDWGTGTDDFHRPLADRGKRGAQRVGTWLARQGLIPDLVITSPAERALVSAEKCCKAMGLGIEGILRNDRIYLATSEQLLELIKECPTETRRVMLVGHNPGFETLVGDLAAEAPATPADGKLMPTATLARFMISGTWASLGRGQAQLAQLVRPSSLPKKFPFPSPFGEELRDRPAYYYTQSSVIPYRVRDGRVEILIISSSKNKHWVIPKGIADPELSPQESARKEAWEEAGIEGEVGDQPVGHYTYPKWGATCTVSVYPMTVERELPEHEWEERHRGRYWVTAKEAEELLKQPELGPMILALETQLTGG
jgi:phosphohistidine phosphatase